MAKKQTLVNVLAPILAALLGVSVLARPTRTVAADQSRVPRVLLIHGRDQQAGAKMKVADDWNAAINSALRKAGAYSFLPRERRLFYWYRDALAGSGCTYGSPFQESFDRTPGFDLMPTLREVFTSIADQVPAGPARILAKLIVNDAERYVANGPSTCIVDRGFRDAVDRDPNRTMPVIVIAHSLGSMITYRNLMRNIPDEFAPFYLITIGSMLGEPAVQRTLLGSHADYPAPVPIPVKWWRNLVNKGDVLAFPSASAFYSEFPDKKPVDIMIDTPGSDRHSATAYLSSLEMGQALRAASCAALPTQKGCP